MPQHKTKGSFKPDDKHPLWGGGCELYWHKKARKLINAPKGLIVHHIDHDYKNNNLNNLQLMTQSEHVTLHNKERTGRKKKNCKIRLYLPKILELQHQGFQRKDISEILGITFRLVKRALTSKWRYEDA